MQRSQAKKLWKSPTDHQKLKIQVLKIAVLKSWARLWKVSEDEDHQKLQHQKLKQKEFTSLNNWQDQNQWLGIIYLRSLSYSWKGIFVWTMLTLSISGASLRIVRSYYYYPKWLSNIQIRWNYLSSYRRKFTAINSTNTPASTLSLYNGYYQSFSLNRRQHWKKWLSFYILR
jgi:hypothetical protein